MSLHRWDEAEELFARGKAMIPEDRETLLANVDAELAATVRSLWLNSEIAGAFLDEPLLKLPTRSDSWSIGDCVGGRFKILEFIGAGGMGEVYRARDETLGRVVALKFLNVELTHLPEWRRRLENEARAICSLTHPNICTLYDVAWDAGTPFLVMEYLRGPTLAERIKTGPFSLPEMLATASQVSSGLRHAHLNGVIHRDLKPGNILLTDVGVKLVDFGIAKQLERPSETRTLTFTGAGTIVGSASYMSPEQAEGFTVDRRTDIFTLGCVLYEMATGRKAFLGSSPMATISSVLTSEPIPIQELRSDLPRELDRLIAKCLRKLPADRFQTMDELTACMEQVPSVTAEVREPSRESGVERKSMARRAWLLTALGGTAAAATAGLMIRIPAIWSERSDSLAVLPFHNSSGDPEIEYLADGISESLTNTLSRLQGLRVVARPTASTFKGKQVEVGTLGRLLKVRTILMGRVIRDRDQIKVQATLFDTATGLKLWNKDYQGGLLDVLSMQEDLVRQVQGRLANRQRELQKPSTQNPEAYQLYLKGRFAFARSNVPDIQTGITFFQKALQVDPQYALAYSGLADSYWGLSGNFLAPKDAMSKARAAASRAIELDPELPEGHLSMGVVHGWYDFNWKRSSEYLRTAIELNPNDAAARLWYGWNLLLNGRFDQGIAQGILAYERDPLSAFVETGVAQMHYCAGDYPTAVAKLRSVVNAAPDFFPGHLYLGIAYLYANQYLGAVSELERAISLDQVPPQPLAYLSYAHAKLGRTNTASNLSSRLAELAKSRYVSAYLSAITAAGLGATEDALSLLWKAYEDRDDMVTIVRTDPIFDGLRENASYTALVEKLGFESPTPIRTVGSRA
jgi:serine/threonine-protein kinase